MAALEGEKETTGADLDEKAASKRAEIMAKAHSVVVLCLSDKVLREVAKETTAARILKKLESLYLTKSLANRQSLCLDPMISFATHALRAKELQSAGARSMESVSESLNIKGSKGKKPFKKKNEGPKQSPSEGKESKVCLWCKKPGHLKTVSGGRKKWPHLEIKVQTPLIVSSQMIHLRF